MTDQRIGVLTVDATYHAELGPSIPQSAKVTVLTGERRPYQHDFHRVNAEARRESEAWVAAFGAPAFVKLFPVTLSGVGWVQGYVTFDARLLADKVNGGINETGIKRFRRLMEQALRGNRAEVEVLPRFRNSYQSIDELMAAVAAREAR